MQVFFFCVYIFEAIVAYIYYSDNYTLRRSHIQTFIILLSLYVLAFGANIIDRNTNYINDIVFFAVNFIFSKACFNISTKSSIFHSSFLLAIMFLTELVTEAGASYVLHIPIDAYKNSLAALFIIGIISKTLYLFVCKLISYFFSYKKHSENDNKRTIVLFLYPIMITATLTIFLYASTKYDFSDKLNLLCIIISILSLVFCCFIFIFNQIVQAQQNELLQLQVQNQKNELNNTFYNLLEQKNEEQRIFVHDMKHHIFAMTSMDDIQEIKNYALKIQPEIEKHEFIGKTGNKMLDLILNKYAIIAKTQNIDFIVDIRLSNLNFIDDNDLSSLLGNLLDNAVEAAENCNNPYIRFTTNIEKNFTFLSIINSSLQPPVTKNDLLVSTKTNSEYHGYGTKSIEKTAEKYNGICHWEYKTELQEFHFNILFNNRV